MVSARTFHADLRFTRQALDGGDEFIYRRLGVAEIPWRHENYIPWLADCNGALPLGDINADCVHKTHPFG